MKIALLNVDRRKFPNLALMKISAYHKANGDSVEWFDPLFSQPDILYASKIFTNTSDYEYFPTGCEIIRGGTGYNVKTQLHPEIEHMRPDYTLYPEYPHALGFLTRGCIRKCHWCVVPEKEGDIRVVSDILELAGQRKTAVLMDNNFLAAPEEFVEDQLQKMIRHGIAVDFNQGLDARLVNDKNANLLGSIQYTKYIRFACDTMEMADFVSSAVWLLRRYSTYNKDIFVYFLCKEVWECHRRIDRLISSCEGARIVPFVQPYIDFKGKTSVTTLQRAFANWVNKKAVFHSCTFEEFCKTKNITEAVQ